MRLRSHISKSLIFFLASMALSFSSFAFAEEAGKKAEPIIINGDRVEYVTESKEFTASGNVEVDYKGSKLTCARLVLNTETKDVTAQGNARLDTAEGTVEGDKLIYNFNTKVGTIIDAEFRSNPYFGRGDSMRKVSEDEFITRWSYITTCSFDRPHYRIKSRRVNFFPGDKIQTRDSVFYLGPVPVLYLPRYNHSLRDPMMHIQLMPGKSKDWGYYLLTASRYNLTEDITGRLYLDLRSKLGVGEGFGVNYKGADIGKGDFKFYYTHEEPRERFLNSDSNSDRILERPTGRYQRYLIRLRHKWEPDERTNAMVEYYKIADSKRTLLGSGNNFLKDYFFREYEKDSQPLSYISAHRAFDYASLDLVIQKRVNRWYSQEEKLPEIKFTLPQFKVASTPFYFEDASSYMNYNYKNEVPSDRDNDITYNQYDTYNKISLPTRVSFINFTPFTSVQALIQDKNDVYGSTAHLTGEVGSELTTKFYRLFNIKTDFLGLNINNLRHVITPTANYTYTNTSLTPTNKLKLGGDSSTGGGAVALALENKLQTKRSGQSVDLAYFNINTVYNVRSNNVNPSGSGFSDFLFDLELRPYSWMEFKGDATFKRSGGESEVNYNHFSDANFDLNFSFGSERSFGIGQRYERKGGNDLTYSLIWRLNPKWKVSFYQRRNFKDTASASAGLREQEYTISRDFHCWAGELTYNVKRGHGEGIWLVFRLKAFPELEFEYNQSYHAPKPGSQSSK